MVLSMHIFVYEYLSTRSVVAVVLYIILYPLKGSLGIPRDQYPHGSCEVAMDSPN